MFGSPDKRWRDDIASVCGGHKRWRDDIASVCGGHKRWRDDIASVCGGHKRWRDDIASVCGGHEAHINKLLRCYYYGKFKYCWKMISFLLVVFTAGGYRAA